MARIRSIKPDFFRSRSVKRLTSDAKLVWIGLWLVADDHGRLLDETGLLAGDLWALSIAEAKLEKILAELDQSGRIIRYESAGQRYIQVTNWTEHQRISHPTDSVIPPASLPNDSGIAPEPFALEGKGRERKGGEGHPTPYCPKHPNGTEAPCGPCRTARIALEASVAAASKAEKSKVTPTPPRKIDPATCDHTADENGYCTKCQERAA